MWLSPRGASRSALRRRGRRSRRRRGRDASARARAARVGRVDDRRRSASRSPGDPDAARRGGARGRGLRPGSVRSGPCGPTASQGRRRTLDEEPVDPADAGPARSSTAVAEPGPRPPRRRGRRRGALTHRPASRAARRRPWPDRSRGGRPDRAAPPSRDLRRASPRARGACARRRSEHLAAEVAGAALLQRPRGRDVRACASTARQLGDPSPRAASVRTTARFQSRSGPATARPRPRGSSCPRAGARPC